MREFKPGDKVRMLNNCPFKHFASGDILTLKNYDKLATGWDCEEKHPCCDIMVWINDSDKFELVTEASCADAFLVGDIVEAFGVRGVVKRDAEDSDYPIAVRFEGGNDMSFTMDGKYFDWHKEPSLKLLERPVKEVTFESYVVGVFGQGFQVQPCSELKSFEGKQVIVTVKLK